MWLCIHFSAVFLCSQPTHKTIQLMLFFSLNLSLFFHTRHSYNYIAQRELS